MTNTLTHSRRVFWKVLHQENAFFKNPLFMFIQNRKGRTRGYGTHFNSWSVGKSEEKSWKAVFYFWADKKVNWIFTNKWQNIEFLTVFLSFWPKKIREIYGSSPPSFSPSSGSREGNAQSLSLFFRFRWGKKWLGGIDVLDGLVLSIDCS